MAFSVGFGLSNSVREFDGVFVCAIIRLGVGVAVGLGAGE